MVVDHYLVHRVIVDIDCDPKEPTMTNLPKCPMCWDRGTYIDEDHPDGYAPCSCEAGLPSNPKPKTHRISDELLGRVVEIIDTLKGLSEHDIACAWRRKGFDCDCATGQVEHEAACILTELAEVRR